MTERDKPRVLVEVTFLRPEEGGRMADAHNGPFYRPHLVVGDPGQRAPITAADGRTLTEEYLGVGFTGEGGALPAGQRHLIELALIYSPTVNYDALTPGATFTVREGGHIVGFGAVKDRKLHVSN